MEHLLTHPQPSSSAIQRSANAAFRTSSRGPTLGMRRSTGVPGSVAESSGSGMYKKTAGSARAVVDRSIPPAKARIRAPTSGVRKRTSRVVSDPSSDDETSSERVSRGSSSSTTSYRRDQQTNKPITAGANDKIKPQAAPFPLLTKAESTGNPSCKSKPRAAPFPLLSDTESPKKTASKPKPRAAPFPLTLTSSPPPPKITPKAKAFPCIRDTSRSVSPDRTLSSQPFPFLSPSRSDTSPKHRPEGPAPFPVKLDEERLARYRLEEEAERARQAELEAEEERLKANQALLALGGTINEEGEYVPYHEQDKYDYCCFCGERMPDDPSDALMLEEARLIQRSTPAPLTSHPRRRVMPFELYTEFCATHRMEREIMPKAIEAGYPMTIDWLAIPLRLEQEWARREMKRVLNDPSKSIIFRQCVGEYHRLGMARWRAETMQGPDKAHAGYYGDIGVIVLQTHLLDLLEWHLLPTLESATRTCDPLSPRDFIRHVLVPECAILLVMQDRGYEGDVSTRGEARRDAMQVWKEGKEFGKLMWKGDGGEVEGVEVGLRRRRERRRGEIIAGREREERARARVKGKGKGKEKGKGKGLGEREGEMDRIKGGGKEKENDPIEIELSSDSDVEIKDVKEIKARDNGRGGDALPDRTLAHPYSRQRSQSHPHTAAYTSLSKTRSPSPSSRRSHSPSSAKAQNSHREATPSVVASQEYGDEWLDDVDMDQLDGAVAELIR